VAIAVERQGLVEIARGQAQEVRHGAVVLHRHLGPAHGRLVRAGRYRPQRDDHEQGDPTQAQQSIELDRGCTEDYLLRAAMARRDYSDVLGVARNADSAEIKKAYRRLAMDFHPDRNPGSKDSEDRFKEASEAYEVLSDPDKRAHYDRFGFEGLRATGFEGFSGIDDIFSHFSDLFGDFFAFAGAC